MWLPNGKRKVFNGTQDGWITIHEDDDAEHLRSIGRDTGGSPFRDDGAPGRRSRFFSAADWQGKPVPPREWLVPGLVPHRNVTLLGGDGGTGKSLLALQLAIGVASGRGWIGRGVETGPAIYFGAEDDEDELHRRSDDVRRHLGLSFADLSALTLRSLAGEDALLAAETRQYGEHGPQPIAYRDIEAWAYLMRVPLEPHHVEALVAMDRVWLAHVAKRPEARPAGNITAELFDARLG